MMNGKPAILPVVFLLLIGLSGTAFSVRVPGRVSPFSSRIADASGDYALKFDGRNDYLIVTGAEPLEYEGSITIELWLRFGVNPPAAIPECMMLACAGEELWLVYDVPGQLTDRVPGQFYFTKGYYWWGGHATEGLVMERDVWHHVALTHDSAEVRFYVDGILNSSRPRNTQKWTPADLIVGTWNRLPQAWWFEGVMDEFMIWNVARSEEQVRQDMMGGLTGGETGLVLYWDFEEGTGQVVHDRSPNGYHAQIGSASSEDDSDPVWVLCAGLPPPLNADLRAHIEPAEPRSVEDLECVTQVINETDYPTLAYSYEWYECGRELTEAVEVNGEILEVTASVLSEYYTDKNETFFCVACITDGTSSFEVKTAQVWIGNTTPSAPVVEIRPAEPSPGQSLALNIETYSIDPDGDTVAYRIEWFESEDGGETWIHKVELNGHAFIDGLYMEEGDLWRVVVTPYEEPLPKKAVQADPVEGEAGWDQVYVGENVRPTISVDVPGAENAIAMPKAVIAWHAEDADGDAVWVDLYYDSDGVKGGGILIAGGLPPVGMLRSEPPQPKGAWVSPDLSGDGSVGEEDLFLLAGMWQTEPPGDRYRIFARAWDSKGAIGETFSEGEVIVPAALPASHEGLFEMIRAGE